MQPSTAINLATNDEPSKWWFWGLAIGIALFSSFGAIGSGIGVLIPIDTYLGDWNQEEPGPYPDNGTAFEQNEWNISKEDWDFYEITTTLMEEMEPIRQLQFEAALVSFLIAIPTCFLLFSKEYNGFYAAGFWVAFNGLASAYLSWKSTKLTNAYLEQISSISGEGSGIISNIQMFSTGMTIASQLTCYVVLIGIVVLAAIKSKDRGEISASGFHITQGEQTHNDDPPQS